jgi:hypothetical protein
MFTIVRDWYVIRRNSANGTEYQIISVSHGNGMYPLYGYGTWDMCHALPFTTYGQALAFMKCAEDCGVQPMPQEPCDCGCHLRGLLPIPGCCACNPDQDSFSWSSEL